MQGKNEENNYKRNYHQPTKEKMSMHKHNESQKPDRLSINIIKEKLPDIIM